MSNETKHSPQTPEEVQHPFTHPPYAFPVHAVVKTPGGIAHMTSSGMTLRDYFAGQALLGIVGDPMRASMSSDCAAELAYGYADAMLKARVGT